jgi:hypothetical protein
MTIAYLSYRYSETGAKRRLNGAMERSTTPSALDDPTQSASAAAQQPEPRQVNGDGREATDKRTAANIEISTSAPKDLTVCVTHYFIGQFSPLPDFCLILLQIQTDNVSIGTRSESDGEEDPQSVILAPSTFGQFVRYHPLRYLETQN